MSDYKLYRSSTDGVVAGVCAGIADYFGFDVTITRVLFVIGALFFPMLILVYLALALLLHKRPTGMGGEGADGEDGDLRRRIRAEPHATLGSVRHRYRELDQRLQRLEKYVTSERFKLDREFEGLRD